ncbi:MAG TPA: hypothetical protein VKG91_12760, partial [Roseiarcus sp.]|nr:hypothetical protein [Roseiarcus sp.]
DQLFDFGRDNHPTVDSDSPHAVSKNPPTKALSTTPVTFGTHSTLGVTSQYGFARKSLKSPNSRKKKAWNLLPLALNFLPTDLDFPSRGFGNPSAPHRAALSRLRRALTKARRPRRGTSRC